MRRKNVLRMIQFPFLESISGRTNKATRISQGWHDEPSACSTTGGRTKREQAGDTRLSRNAVVACSPFRSVWPVCFLLLIFQGSQGVLQTIGQDLQLLGQFVLLAELLAQQHQVARGVVQRDVAQVQAPPGEVVQVHHTGEERGR